MACDPSITDWMGAVSTAALGILGAIITVWQWHRTGFRPRLTSRIDGPREAIELVVVNSGRAGGIIDEIHVADAEGNIVEEAEYEGFTDNRFRPLALPAMASMRIIVQAPPDKRFAADVSLLVFMGGAAKPEEVKPRDIAPGTGLYGLHSVLPPGIITGPGG